MVFTVHLHENVYYMLCAIQDVWGFLPTIKKNRIAIDGNSAMAFPLFISVESNVGSPYFNLVLVHKPKSHTPSESLIAALSIYVPFPNPCLPIDKPEHIEYIYTLEQTHKHTHDSPDPNTPVFWRLTIHSSIYIWAALSTSQSLPLSIFVQYVQAFADEKAFVCLRQLRRICAPSGTSKYDEERVEGELVKVGSCECPTNMEGSNSGKLRCCRAKRVVFGGLYTKPCTSFLLTSKQIAIHP